MKANRSCLVVVDTSVIHSANEPSISRNCRNALWSILKICHCVVITYAIVEEWKRHDGVYTRKWRHQMHGRKKIKIMKEDKLPPISFDESKFTEGDLKALKKDMPLLKTACAGDGVIITRDKSVIEICSKYKKHIKLPKPIRWIIPDDNIIEHLENL
jgi:hypothetical protein